MRGNQTLKDAFNQTTYQTVGHGKRVIQVLKNALAAVDGAADSDYYGMGQVIEQFQHKMAAYLGKPAAVFFPSGTMAQQIALRIWCDELGIARAAYHPLCHLEIHEQDGLRKLHRIEPVHLADKERTIELNDVLQMKEEIACLLLELPQREIGGQLPAYEDLVRIADHCRGKGIRMHLDGARLYEILPYYKKTAAEISSLFDSVYVSLYKGIGGIAGAILAGDEAFTEQSKIWKRRHGGDLISLYPYIVSADIYLDERLPRMEQYYRNAIELAELYNECHGITTKPAVPVSNMFHVHAAIPKEKLEAILISVYEQTGIGLTGNVRETGAAGCYFEVSIGDKYAEIPKDKLHGAMHMLNTGLRNLG